MKAYPFPNTLLATHLELLSHVLPRAMREPGATGVEMQNVTNNSIVNLHHPRWYVFNTEEKTRCGVRTGDTSRAAVIVCVLDP
ncbi:hypothetical protein J6590_010056 [Homalodisca vitripennis]|nr:hypothetical protein J6590_010056 [Homalodisca vitripennis]